MNNPTKISIKKHLKYNHWAALLMKTVSKIIIIKIRQAKTTLNWAIIMVWGKYFRDKLILNIRIISQEMIISTNIKIIIIYWILWVQGHRFYKIINYKFWSKLRNLVRS